MAASHAVQQIKWIRQLLSDLGLNQTQPTIMLEDNQACIKMVEKESLSQRTKHIDIKYHFIKDEQKNGVIKLNYIKSEEHIADMLTKPLAIARFRFLRDQIMIEARTSEEGVGDAGAASISCVDSPDSTTGRRDCIAKGSNSQAV